MRAETRAETRLGAIAVQWPECILLEDRACSWGLRYSTWVLVRFPQRSLPIKVQTEKEEIVSCYEKKAERDIPFPPRVHPLQIPGVLEGSHLLLVFLH